MTGWIVIDRDYARTPVTEIGGKAAGLGLLVANAAPCPPSFCVTTSALRHGLDAGGGLPGDLDEAIRAAVETLPRRPDGRYSLAVRSSFVSEDTPRAISPGIYHSEVGVFSPEEIGPALQRVWASAFTPGAIAYRRSSGLPPYEPGMAVIIQHAPRPVAGGVVYTLLPGTDDATALLIEYAEGSPAGVVDGRARVSTRVIPKRTRAVEEIAAGPFTTAHAETLVGWALTLERAGNRPLDIEWLVDDAGDLWLLQARGLPYRAEPAPGLVAEARGTTLRSAKLTPFRLGGSAAVTTVPASLLLPGAFAMFKRHGGTAPPELVTACRSVFGRYLARGPVSLRSAYWSALDSGDMMPQSGLLTTVEECLEHTFAFWRFVMDSRRDDYTAEVALLVCNWTDLRASLIATVPPDTAPATVAALYGQLDGLEGCAHDVYEIDLATLAPRAASVPDKPLTVRMPGHPPEPVPPELRDARVLDDAEITAVGRNLAAVREAYGPARVELLVLNGTGTADERVITWQVSPLTAAEARLRYFRVAPAGDAGATGTLVRVHDAADVREMLGTPGAKVAYIDLTRPGFRDPTRATALVAELKRAGCPVLLSGSLLSHFAALLRDYRVTVYPVLEAPEGIATGTPVVVEPLG